MKTRKTDLRFTQSEVRHIVCLLIRNIIVPEDLTKVRGESVEASWKRDHESLTHKFNNIDRRFDRPQGKDGE